jgi:outer membrane murein-binding lipoprotein Lpp
MDVGSTNNQKETTMTTGTITDITAEIERLEAELARASEEARNARGENAKNRAALRDRIHYARVDHVVGDEKFNVMVILKDDWCWGREYNKKTRIFTDGVDLDKINEEARPHYVAYGEQSDEYKKAGRVYRKEERRIIAATLEAAGIKWTGMKFSQKAGCSTCSCSPGWVADDVLTVEGFRIDSIFVTQVRNAEGEVK